MTDANPLQSQPPTFALIAGKPGSGKTSLLKYLLMLDHEDFNSADPIRYAVVFTTTKFNRYYEKIFPADYIHQRYEPAALQAIMDIQAATGAAHRAAVIFDDCLDQRAFASQLFTNLCTTFRHYRLDVYIVTQYLYKVPPTVRECATRVAVFRMTTERSLAALFESFGAFFSSLDEFRKWLMPRTGDYRFVWYIANSSAEDRAQIYKEMKCPESLPEFAFEY